jgi:hypothetical protein
MYRHPSSRHDTPDDSNGPRGPGLAAYYATKYRLIGGFYDGRGGFRTCDLSRVKNEKSEDPDAGSEP